LKGYDINNSGEVVGFFADANANYGFLNSGGTYTTLDDPSGSETTASDINSDGQIVGSYFANGTSHGFLYSGGTYTTLNDPLATGSTVQHTRQATTCPRRASSERAAFAEDLGPGTFASPEVIFRLDIGWSRIRLIASTGGEIAARHWQPPPGQHRCCFYV
jgi:probable HAF family extracellular repeat protein